MKRSQAWKATERLVAMKLGGKRLWRGGDFGQSLGDLLHEKYTVEVKYRSYPPKLYVAYFNFFKNVKNFVIMHRGRIILSLDDFVSLTKEKGHYEKLELEEKPLNTFFEKALAQAISYDPTKIPMFVYKKAKQRNEWVYMKREDFEKLVY